MKPTAEIMSSGRMPCPVGQAAETAPAEAVATTVKGANTVTGAASVSMKFQLARVLKCCRAAFSERPARFAIASSAEAPTQSAISLTASLMTFVEGWNRLIRGSFRRLLLRLGLSLDLRPLTQAHGRLLALPLFPQLLPRRHDLRDFLHGVPVLRYPVLRVRRQLTAERHVLDEPGQLGLELLGVVEQQCRLAIENLSLVGGRVLRQRCRRLLQDRRLVELDGTPAVVEDVWSQWRERDVVSHACQPDLVFGIVAPVVERHAMRRNQFVDPRELG